MTDMRECSACGTVSYSVSPKIVRYDSGTLGDGSTIDDIYVMELRCADWEACRDRTEAVGVTGPGERQV